MAIPLVLVVLAWFCTPLAAASVSGRQSDASDVSSLLRQTISFDFGWKHRAGLHQWPEDPYDPPINTTASGYVDPGIAPQEASEDYQASDWIHVRLPHDGLISNPFGNAPSTKACPDGCSGRSGIPRHVLWYRKQFKLPAAAAAKWQDELLDQTSRIFLRFDGSFRNTTVYLNGKIVMQHECGYTPFRIELTAQNLGLLEDSKKKVHTIAIFVDPNNGDYGGPSRGSGWWYEGGGLYRRSWLEKVPRANRFSHEGVFVTTKIFGFAETNPQQAAQEQRELSSKQKNSNLPASVASVAAMTIRTTFEIQGIKIDYCFGFAVESNDEQSSHRDPIVVVKPLDLLEEAYGDAEDKSRGTSKSKRQTQSFTFNLTDVNLWTSSNPHLYKVTASLYTNCKAKVDRNAANNDVSIDISDADLLDEVSVHHGIRSTRFDPNTGFYWNEAPFKIRGFCDHDTFAVVGMAVPDRINLFRAQASRSIGGNARRASHNPPNPEALSIYDRLGMVVIDENRLFDNNMAYVQNMADLVHRDRNHPSVIVWSFCNEVGCEEAHETGGPPFQAISSALDGSRPTLANMFTFHDLLSDTIDVQGFSHRHRDTLDKCHADLPNKPIIQSECCSCNTMRDTDEGMETKADNPHRIDDQKSFNARCLENLVNASDGTEYASGTFVWTLLDYYGEPPKWPFHVSSTYGQFDLCGFPKAAAFWFRSQWLLESFSKKRNSPFKSVVTAAIANGRPFKTGDSAEVYIVESWESPDHWNATKGNTTRTIHVYSNAPVVELGLLGVKVPRSFGNKTIVPMVDGDGGTYGEWKDIPWEPGLLFASAYDHDGGLVANTQKWTNPSNPWVSLELSLDCPSPHTGTGSALFLDGSDVALVRATLVDLHTHQRLVFADNVVEFSVIQGPGRILGTANGDPKSKRPHTDSFHPAHHGLVRAVVGVTSIAGWSTEEKDLLSSMEIDDETSCDLGTRDTPNCYSKTDDRDIIIEAKSEGLVPVRLTIPTSTNRDKDSVLSVAARGAGRPVDLVMG